MSGPDIVVSVLIICFTVYNLSVAYMRYKAVIKWIERRGESQ
jgi:uncharacterized membrane protein YidH (DUF202 family)